MAESTEEDRRADLYLAEARWRRDDQSRRHDSLNQRLVTAFTLNVAVIAVLSAALRFGDPQFEAVVEYLVYATAFMFFINIGATAWGYRVGRGFRRPDLQRLREVAEQYSYAIMATWTGDEIRRALGENEKALRRKGQWVTVALVSSTLTVLMVAATAALALGLG